MPELKFYDKLGNTLVFSRKEQKMSNEYWKSLCERVNITKRKKKEEDPLHDTLENEFELTFKWPSEHIMHKPTVPSGTGKVIPDIVLEGDGFGIVIEVKAPGVIIGEDQLISYMDLYKTHRNGIKCKYGFLIGDRIKLYFRKDPEKNPELIASFDFDIDSQDGNDLAEILYYENCSYERLSEYMNRPHEIKERTPPPRPEDDVSKGMKKFGNDIFADKEKYNDTVKAVIEGVQQSKEIKIEGIERPVILDNFGILKNNDAPLPDHKVVYFHILNGNPKYKYWVTVIKKRGRYVAKCSLNIDGKVAFNILKPIENLESSVIIDRIRNVIFEAIVKLIM